ncbi:hypothetical protein F5Y01DRAFT_308732 [Xylaria sp. FL0043]|nr:hypothetical protein F5Y01DRAFT_308732 [Xylaria sp. FL0043]
MVSATSLFYSLLYGSMVFAFPANIVTPQLDHVLARQATVIPDNALYLIEWWPMGCGNGGGTTLTGSEDRLAVCVNTDSLFDETPTNDTSVRFLFPDDGETYRWKLFGTNNCSEQISQGEGGGCFTVPTSQRVGAIIVYT